MNIAEAYAACCRAEAAYIIDPAQCRAAFEALGLEFVGQYQQDNAQAVVSRDPYGWYLSISGTRFSDGKLGDLGDDLELRSVNVGGGALVTAGAYEPLADLWKWALMQIPDGEVINVEGHSLGAWRTRYTPLFIPDSRTGMLYSFESPKGGNQSYWANYASRLRNLVSIVNGRDLWVSWPFPSLLGTHWCHPPSPMIWLQDAGYQYITPDAWPGGRVLGDHDISLVKQRLRALMPSP